MMFGIQIRHLVVLFVRVKITFNLSALRESVHDSTTIYILKILCEATALIC